MLIKAETGNDFVGWFMAGNFTTPILSLSLSLGEFIYSHSLSLLEYNAARFLRGWGGVDLDFLRRLMGTGFVLKRAMLLVALGGGGKGGVVRVVRKSYFTRIFHRVSGRTATTNFPLRSSQNESTSTRRERVSRGC